MDTDSFLGARQGTAPVLLDCITFGAPPVLDRNITSELKSCLTARSIRESVFFALIIEGDPVPRLDMAYAIFLGTALGQIRQPAKQPATLPSLTVHTMGELVMFRDVNLKRDGTDIHMYAIEEEVLGNAAFVNLCVHFMFVHMGFVDLASCLRLRGNSLMGFSGSGQRVHIQSS